MCVNDYTTIDVLKRLSLPQDREKVDAIEKWAGDSYGAPKEARLHVGERFGMLGHYSPSGWQWKQLQKPTDPKAWWPFGQEVTYVSGHFIYFHNETGLAYLYVVRKKDGKQFTDSAYEWWDIGCDHEDEHVANLGNCYNRYKCKKCGYTHDVDSSD